MEAGKVDESDKPFNRLQLDRAYSAGACEGTSGYPIFMADKLVVLPSGIYVLALRATPAVDFVHRALR